MFYITEIYFRIVYLILLIFCLFVLYYEYKETTLIIFLVPSKIFGYNCIEHFIYTHPTELLFALLNLNFFLIVICLIPYLMWLIVDFLRTGLFLNEYQKIKIYSKIFSLLIVLLNIILFVFFFPIIFNFFESFNSFESQSINIKFEL